MVYERLSRGTIGPDDAAHELGYDSAYKSDAAVPVFNPGFTFSFDRDRNKYIFVRESIQLGSEKKKTMNMNMSLN
jgi:hypothetical protein